MMTSLIGILLHVHICYKAFFHPKTIAGRHSARAYFRQCNIPKQGMTSHLLSFFKSFHNLTEPVGQL